MKSRLFPEQRPVSTADAMFVGNRWNNVHLTLARKKEASS